MRTSSRTGGMAMLRRWLDPPAVVERKRLLRSLPRTPGQKTELEFGCRWPLGLTLAVAIGVGVVIGTRLQTGAEAPREVVVRVIDDGAMPGPKVLTTQVVPLR